MTWMKSACYVVAQLLGAMVAGAGQVAGGGLQGYLGLELRENQEIRLVLRNSRLRILMV